MIKSFVNSTIDEIVAAYRPAIMGFATIMVLLFHQYAVHDLVLLDVFSHIGHWGVDIFLLVSGFGITMSLSKNTISRFYCNRLKRILPICLVIGAFGITLAFFKGELDYIDLPIKLLCLNNWYIYTICLYYLISPILVRGVRHSPMLILIAYIALAIVLESSHAFEPLSNHSFCLVNKIPWAWDRLLVFGIGIYCTCYKLNVNQYFVAMPLFVYLLLAQYHIVPQPYVFMPLLAFCVPMLCMYIAFIVSSSKYLNSVFSFFGKHSLSIFLVHLIVYSYGEVRSAMIPECHLRLLIEIIATVTISVCLDLFIGWSLDKLEYLKSKRV